MDEAPGSDFETPADRAYGQAPAPKQPAPRPPRYSFLLWVIGTIIVLAGIAVASTLVDIQNAKGDVDEAAELLGECRREILALAGLPAGPVSELQGGEVYDMAVEELRVARRQAASWSWWTRRKAKSTADEILNATPSGLRPPPCEDIVPGFPQPSMGIPPAAA